MKKILALMALFMAVSCVYSTGQNTASNELEIPAYSADEDVVRHMAYTTCYNHKTLLPDWVAWELSSEETDGPCSRNGVGFAWDPDVKWPKSTREDYSNCGWDKGHMAPAADMRWSEQAMRECFYLSNICPQNHEMNSGDWATTENMSRRMAKKYGKTWIVCGPVFGKHAFGTIGANKVAVPDAFFKAMLIQKTDGSYSSIAFVIPNTPDHHDPNYYKRTVDDVEALIGRDLYPNLPDEVEERVESVVVKGDWGI